MADTTTNATSAATRTDWKLLIGGEQVDAASGETFDVINPTIQELLRHVGQSKIG